MAGAHGARSAPARVWPAGLHATHNGIVPPSYPDRPGVLAQLRAVLAWRDTRLLALVFLVTQLLDVLTTWRALNTRRFSEGNPWLDEVTNAHPFLVYGAKLFCAVLVLVALLLLRLRWRLRRAVLALFTVAALVAPVANILRIRGVL
jgi:hypothetical protein